MKKKSTKTKHKVEKVLNDSKFKYINQTLTVGKLSKYEYIKEFFKHTKRIGGFKVALLREFLRHLDADDVVGVYYSKKYGLMPLHSNRWMVAPRSQESDNFEEIYLEGK